MPHLHLNPYERRQRLPRDDPSLSFSLQAYARMRAAKHEVHSIRLSARLRAFMLTVSGSRTEERGTASREAQRSRQDPKGCKGQHCESQAEEAADV